ncbi:OmpA family protein, partial [Lutibacter sp. HS1-25]|uniref:OmpA family protein n=1 Tax=Lutibacter sp. HS1-25 TaxID=2485000 RepID=UPI0010279D65
LRLLLLNFKVYLQDFSSFGLEKEKEIKVDLNIALAPIEDVAILADLKIIYFDLDKSNIRPDAALELDKVVALMNKYPGMVIKLGSHTDSRADDAYNMALLIKNLIAFKTKSSLL